MWRALGLPLARHAAPLRLHSLAIGRAFLFSYRKTSYLFSYRKACCPFAIERDGSAFSYRKTGAALEAALVARWMLLWLLLALP